MNLFNKWKIIEKIPIDKVEEKINELEQRIESLESENKDLINELYQIENSIDARIDILVLGLLGDKNV